MLFLEAHIEAFGVVLRIARVPSVFWQALRLKEVLLLSKWDSMAFRGVVLFWRSRWFASEADHCIFGNRIGLIFNLVALDRLVMRINLIFFRLRIDKVFVNLFVLVSAAGAHFLWLDDSRLAWLLAEYLAAWLEAPILVLSVVLEILHEVLRFPLNLLWIASERVLHSWSHHHGLLLLGPEWHLFLASGHAIRWVWIRFWNFARAFQVLWREHL